MKRQSISEQNVYVSVCVCVLMCGCNNKWIHVDIWRRFAIATECYIHVDCYAATSSAGVCVFCVVTPTTPNLASIARYISLKCTPVISCSAHRLTPQPAVVRAPFTILNKVKTAYFIRMSWKCRSILLLVLLFSSMSMVGRFAHTLSLSLSAPVLPDSALRTRVCRHLQQHRCCCQINSLVLKIQFSYHFVYATATHPSHHSPLPRSLHHFVVHASIEFFFHSQKKKIHWSVHTQSSTIHHSA